MHYQNNYKTYKDNQNMDTTAKTVKIPELQSQREIIDGELAKIDVAKYIEIPRDDAMRWSHHISRYVHPTSVKRFTVQINKKRLPDGVARVWRTK